MYLKQTQGSWPDTTGDLCRYEAYLNNPLESNMQNISVKKVACILKMMKYFECTAADVSGAFALISSHKIR